MAHTKANIYLIGPMGSGKTTIGRRVSEILEREFFDCDAELEQATGASVNLIFDIEGEEGFRERESRVLRELSLRENSVVATGGGVVLRPENRAVMKGSGLVVYLRTPVAQQLRRLRLDQTRPLLQTQDREKRLVELAEKRDPIYESLADIVFPGQNRSVPVAAQRLSSVILSYWSDA